MHCCFWAGVPTLHRSITHHHSWRKVFRINLYINPQAPGSGNERMMFSGDETGGLVADYGTHTSKFGFAGEDCPRSVWRTQHDFSTEFSKGIAGLSEGIDPSDHPIIATVPWDLSDKEKIQWTGKAFELNAPAVYLLRSPVAGAFAVGKSTALVVEVGASSARVCPVYEGHALLKCTRSSTELGGEQLSKAVAVAVGSQLAAPAKNAAKEKVALYRLRVDDIKQTCCQVWRTPPFSASSVPESNRGEYALPDGKIVRLGSSRYELCESLFDKTSGIAALVYDSLSACEPDLRRTFAQEIVINGGGSLLDGLGERLGAELSLRLPHAFKPRVVSPGSTIERKFAPFVGCSVLASLGSFQQLWLSRKEWDEEGERLVIERFVQ